MKKILTATLLFGLSIFANGLFAQELSAEQLKTFQTDNSENFLKVFSHEDYSKCYTVNGSSVNLLSLSVKNNKTKIFNELVKNTDVNKSCNEVTPLMYAATAGNMDAAKMLIKYGAKKDTKDSKGKTAKDYALKNKQATVAMIL
ncbi:ankyrin repeat domain-containing protein [uncultured Chryseobacterium sp.]|uniref:ankyrin repeat domain-containing protein n=1 Tax=uncultured Chryseobacterium sp. TaxID=259322 RepID=UPI0025F7F0D8|nr:ankyrin repeat domain-containing protein [uncultured Chryseobacterium sp.]